MFHPRKRALLPVLCEQRLGPDVVLDRQRQRAGLRVLQPKGLYLVRPAMQQYLSTKEELDEASKIMFEKISSGKVKINIFKKYKLDQVVEAHKDLEGRKILGPAVIIPS